MQQEKSSGPPSNIGQQQTQQQQQQQKQQVQQLTEEELTEIASKIRRRWTEMVLEVVEGYTKVEQCMDDIEKVPEEHRHLGIREIYDAMLEQQKKHRMATADILVHAVRNSRALSLDTYLHGLKLYMDGIDDILIDVPLIWEIIPEYLGRLSHSFSHLIFSSFKRHLRTVSVPTDIFNYIINRLYFLKFLHSLFNRRSIFNCEFFLCCQSNQLSIFPSKLNLEQFRDILFFFQFSPLSFLIFPFQRLSSLIFISFPLTKGFL